MITALDPISTATVANPEVPAQAKAKQVERANTDTVTISDEARLKLKASFENQTMVQESLAKEAAEKEEKEIAWNLANGLREGTYYLKNGNKRVVTIEDDTLSIEEFKDGKLVKTVTGSITENGAELDTAYYDKAGDVSQAIHSVIMVGDGSSKWSVASMSRTVQWFDGDKLQGEMQDQMLLSSWDNLRASEDVDKKVDAFLGMGASQVEKNTDDLSKMITTEKHISNYYAHITEYGDNGNLARDMVIEQEGRFTQASNRSDKKIGDIDERSSREVKRNVNLSVEINDYDSDGKLIRNALITDSQVDEADKTDNMQRQTVDVSWYSKGELVKRSHGDMTLSETDYARLPKRPGIIETLGMNTEEYLGTGDKPKTAIELLNTKLMDSSSESDFYVHPIASHVAAGDYSAAQGVAQNGSPDRPYSITWTDEIFKDGKLAVRQTDSEEAHRTSYFQRQRGMLFRKGGGLTENAHPVVLRETSHEQAVYAEGQMTAHQSVEARESVDIDNDGPDKKRVRASFSKGVGSDEVKTVVSQDGGVALIDTIPHAAAKGFANEMELTLKGLYESTHTLNGDIEVDDTLGYAVRLEFASEN